MEDQAIHEDDQIAMLSQLYSGLYTTPDVPPQQGDQSCTTTKQRRRRKKAKSSEGVGLKKRKLSEEQVNLLEKSFGCEHKLESERKDRLALELGLDPRQVAVWFQNRRARWKNKRLEEEYSKLKSQHESVVLEKCHLESELLKLRDKLTDAQGEIKRLSMERLDHTSSNSPTSSMTMEAAAMEPCGSQLLGADDQNYDLGSFVNVFYLPDEVYNSNIPCMEWPTDLYNM